MNHPIDGEHATSELEFWLYFSVGIAVIPLVLLTVFNFSLDPLIDFLKHGELFIIGIAVSGERLGTIYARERNVGTRKFFVFLITFLSSAFGLNSVGHLTDVLVISLSILVFGGIVFVGVRTLRGR